MLTCCSGDFEKHFVCGEIMAYADLQEYGTEAAVKAVRITPRLALLTDSCRLENSCKRESPTRWSTATWLTGSTVHKEWNR